MPIEVDIPLDVDMSVPVMQTSMLVSDEHFYIAQAAGQSSTIHIDGIQVRCRYGSGTQLGLLGLGQIRLGVRSDIDVTRTAIYTDCLSGCTVKFGQDGSGVLVPTMSEGSACLDFRRYDMSNAEALRNHIQTKGGQPIPIKVSILNSADRRVFSGSQEADIMTMLTLGGTNLVEHLDAKCVDDKEWKGLADRMHRLKQLAT